MGIVRDKNDLWGDEYIAETERVCGGRDRFLKIVHSYENPDHKSFNPQKVAWFLEISVTNVNSAEAGQLISLSERRKMCNG